MIKKSLLGCVFGLALISTTSCSSMKATSITPPSVISSLSIAADIDGRISEALEKLEVVQGLSVAVYTPEGVYARGFGVTDIETGEPATQDTAFYIASSTKSMIALALAELHQRGEIDLDMTLTEFAPDAPFPETTKPDQVTLRHLLAQSSGILNEPIATRLAFTGQHDADTLWNLLSITEPNSEQPFGEFKYTNSNFNILALLLKKRLNRSWKDIVAEEIFVKANMTRTTANMSEAEEKNWSIARPHATLGQGTPKRTYLQKTDATMHSAGGVFMSAADAVKWLELLVEDGLLGGRKVVSTAAVKASREPQVTVGKSFGPYTRDQYALGWYTGVYGEQKHQFVHHFGSFAGTRAHVSYMPEEKIGVSVLVNDGEVGFRLVDLIANYVYDELTDAPEASSRYEESIEQLVKQRDIQQVKLLARAREIAAREWTLNQSLEHYAGVYENEQFGTFVVSVEGDRLWFAIGNLCTVASAGREQGSVRVELTPGSGEPIRFKIDADSVVEGLTYSEYTFQKL
jgi:CubicO group peptidase (beta-lactamase class C family)